MYNEPPSNLAGAQPIRVDEGPKFSKGLRGFSIFGALLHFA